MRILHVNKFLYRRGGAEAYMLDLAELQRRAGHRVAFFAMQHPDNEPSEFEHLFPAYLELGSPQKLSAGKKMLATARMFHSRAAEKSMDAVLEAFRPDVIHAHNIYHQLSPSVLRPARRRGIRVVMTLHDYKLICPNYQLLDHGAICEACLQGGFQNAVLRRCKDGSLASSALVAAETFMHRRLDAYGAVDAFVSPSRFLLEKMREGRVHPDRMTHLNHFVDTSAIEPRNEPGTRFLFAGRLSHEKGVDTLIRAVAAARGGVQLDIAGEGPQGDELRELAERIAPEWIRFLGRVPREAVHELMRRSSAVVVPSRWYENQPISVLEALAAGVPVIGSRLGGIPELVEDGVTGLLVEADDVDALAAAMASLAESPQRSAEMGRAARLFAQHNFSPATHLRALDSLYAPQRQPLTEAVSA